MRGSSDRLTREGVPAVRHMRKRRLLAAGVAAVVLIAAGGYAAVAQSSRNSALQPLQFAKTVTQPGGDHLSPQGYLSRDLARIPGHIVDAHIGPPPSGQTSNPGDQLLWVTVAVPRTGAQAIEPLWEARLLGGILNDDLAGASEREINGVDVILQLPDGSKIDAGSGMGDAVVGQQFTTASDATLRHQITAAAQGAGLKITSLKFLHPLQATPIVVVQTSDPHAFLSLNNGDPVSAILGDPNSYEGWYIEADDQTGDPFWIEDFAARVASSSSWERPDVAPKAPTPVNVGTGTNAG
jgi:hypothetical protein